MQPQDLVLPLPSNFSDLLLSAPLCFNIFCCPERWFEHEKTRFEEVDYVRL